MTERPTLYAIDFGTSNSLLGAASADRVFDPVPLDPHAGDPTILRSVLCFPDSGGLYVGVDALQQFVEHGGEARLLRSIKRHLGSRSFRGTLIRNRMVSAEELVAGVLRQMRLRADAHYGLEIRRAVLGWPVHFAGEDDAFAAERLQKAAQLAGALSMLQRRDVATFLADVRRWSLRDEDRRRMDQLTILVEETLGFGLFEAIERAKRELSSAQRAEVVFSHPGIDVREKVTRSGFEEASRREVDEVLSSLDGTVRAAGVSPGDIGVVCCTGGTARVPRIAAEIQRRLPAARMEQFKGFHSVVEGLAREAQAIEGGRRA